MKLDSFVCLACRHSYPEARDLYRQGADAVDLWEMGHAPVRLARWNVLKRIGDREMLSREFGNRIGGLMGIPEKPVLFGTD